MPNRVTAYSGHLPFRNAPEEIADRHLTVTDDAPALETAKFEGGSVYPCSLPPGRNPCTKDVVSRGTCSGRTPRWQP